MGELRTHPGQPISREIFTVHTVPTINAKCRASIAFSLTVFIERLLQARNTLAALYESPVDDAAKRSGKAAVFAALQADVERLIDEAQAGPGYQRFFATPMNNAKLLPFGLYHQWRPAFGVLFAQQGQDWPRFHAAVQALAKLDAPRRQQQLQSLQTQADASSP